MIENSVTYIATIQRSATGGYWIRFPDTRTLHYAPSEEEITSRATMALQRDVERWYTLYGKGSLPVPKYKNGHHRAIAVTINLDDILKDRQ